MTDDWILGFVWGIGTISDSRLLVRYHDKDLLEKICITLHTRSRPYRPAEGKLAIQIPPSHPFFQRLLSLGWTGRLDKDRKYPIGNIDELEFIKGYCHTKATLDMWKYKNRRGEICEKPRLRIWGSYDIVARIDQYFVSELRTAPKKPYLHRSVNGDCWSVSYQSKSEVPRIAELLQLNHT